MRALVGRAVLLAGLGLLLMASSGTAKPQFGPASGQPTVCPEAKCMNLKESIVGAAAQKSTTNSDDVDSGSSAVPIAIGGVCGALVLAAVVAGFVWFRQKRHSVHSTMASSMRSPTTMHNSMRRVSAGSAFSEATRAHPRSMYYANHPTSPNKPSYEAAAGATADLAEFTEVVLNEQGTPRSPQSPLSPHLQINNSVYHPAIASSLNSAAYMATSLPTTALPTTETSAYSPNTQPTTGSLSAMVAAAAAAIDQQVTEVYTDQSASTAHTEQSVATQLPAEISLASIMNADVGILPHHHQIQELQESGQHRRQISNTSSAWRPDSTAESDCSMPAVTIARRETVRSAHRATVVDNVEDLLTPDGRMSHHTPSTPGSATSGEEYAHWPPTASASPAVSAEMAITKENNAATEAKPGDHEADWMRSSFAMHVFDALATEPATPSDVASAMTPRTGELGLHADYPGAGDTTFQRDSVAESEVTDYYSLGGSYNANAQAPLTRVRPDSELDAGNALFNLATAVASEERLDVETPRFATSAETNTSSPTVDVTIRLPDAIRAVMEANGVSMSDLQTDSPTIMSDRARVTDDSYGDSNESDITGDDSSAYWAWRQQMMRNAESSTH
ncbi:hypothetical protein THASP1DRAFT_24179 [Thamnocephalis sphaerospora]|uniref:Transmembrane protein n=1 Tax=Thamnocephalis sphaerospora TaxID=78915 RepID=A0A4P9XNY8_9FUNG|nr:hypothetical protein THASP1DRAFT_24179 [Thamnocephalis sphaerospora]|eukprot:RKP07717.1 hypothetical protein THASP1DRAFT_24179 [Thamnocephalis sphaerospora]